MSATTNLDRLYELLPPLHQSRDAEQGYPLKALLRVIAEQSHLVELDMERLYENWFIETCQDWVVPYLGELIGYQRVEEAGSPSGVANLRDRLRNRILLPRREVAKTVRMRRRKGTLALLEQLAFEIGGWPARAVEFRPLVSQTQAINHVRITRGRTVDVRDPVTFDSVYGCRLEPESGQALVIAEAVHERLIAHGAFDTLPHTVDVRRIDSKRSRGRYNLPELGLFVFRLQAYRIKKSGALVQRRGSHLFTVSPLGNDMPLFVRSIPEQAPTAIAGEPNLPVPLRRAALIDRRHLDHPQASPAYYGLEKSVVIWTKGWSGHRDDDKPVPARKVIPADLSDWEAYVPSRDTLAFDPVLGRIVFPPKQFPRSGVWVSYHYGFSADIGGGPYPRPISAPEDSFIYRVGADAEFQTIREATDAWLSEAPPHAVIELSDDRSYREYVNFSLATGQTLQLRAKVGSRPIIWLSDSNTWATVIGAANSRFVLDGILVAGLPLNIEGDLAELTIRHCTLVPGSTLSHDCKPERPSEPSIVLMKTKADVNIEHSIVGSIQVKQDEVGADPIRIRIADSILDATSPHLEALGCDADFLAHAMLTVERSTVIGSVETHAIDLAENSIFLGRVKVRRRQHGCMRFCYIDPGPEDNCSRMPRRYRCQPDSALKQLTLEPDWEALSAGEKVRRQDIERGRVRPRFNSLRYGLPTYCQLADSCAGEIRGGADDQSEMGVFHDLYEPQRRAILDARLDEFTPAHANIGILFAT